jgi:hypothetical protein
MAIWETANSSKKTDHLRLSTIRILTNDIANHPKAAGEGRSSGGCDAE